MGGSIPKQFMALAGKRVYLHALEVLRKAGFFDQIVIVCAEGWEEVVRDETGEGVEIVTGGTTRQESSARGIRALRIDVEIALVHDAVRPLVTEDIVRRCTRAALDVGAADTCIASADTLVHAPGGRKITAIPRRSEYLRGQTPQAFRRDWIAQAHDVALREGGEATDDCSLILRAGFPVQVVEGDESNIKITTELDLLMAEQLLRLRRSRPGTGGEPLQGQVFAVVGGTGGIGRRVCQLLEERGARPISLSRKSEQPLDLSDPASIEAAFSEIEREVGLLDGLINCAGKLVVRPLAELSRQEIEELLTVNLLGPILCCKAARLKRGACVVNVASSSFSRGREKMGVYSGAKAGLVNFTQALSQERPDLRVWTVVPQRTNTEMRRHSFPEESPESLLDPQQVAETIAALVSSQHGSGEIVEVRRNLAQNPPPIHARYET